MPPKVDGVCDLCGGELMQRKDDNIETLKARLDEYHNNTTPLVKFYANANLLHEVDGTLPLDKILDDIIAILG